MKQFDKEYCKKFCKGEHTYRGITIHKIEGPSTSEELPIALGYQPDNGHTYQDQVSKLVPKDIMAKEKSKIYAGLKKEMHKIIDCRLDGVEIGD